VEDVNEDEIAGTDSSDAGLYIFTCAFEMTNVSAAIMPDSASFVTWWFILPLT
jgi:hypothetical protein